MSITAEKKQSLIEQYKTSENDSGSTSVQCAILTERITQLTAHLKLHKKDHAARRGLLILVSRRRKLLDYTKKHVTNVYTQLIANLKLKK